MQSEGEQHELSVRDEPARPFYETSEPNLGAWSIELALDLEKEQSYASFVSIDGLRI